MLTNSDINFYKENGYIVAKQAINPKYFEELFETSVNLLKNYGKGLVKSNTEFKSWEDESFHKKMIELRTKLPENFSAVYQAVQKGCSIANLTCHKKILNQVSLLLKERPENLSHTISVLRMDAPNDEKNWFGFHQDSAYFDYPEYVKNINGENNISCWIPMTAVNTKRGAVRLCAKSHKGGFLHNHEKLPMVKPISDEVASKYDIVDVELEAGDAIFFHGATIHCSGHNTSSLIRFAFVTRYYRMLADDFYLHPDVKEKITGVNG